MKSVTITEIAHVAGVSIKTVSRVLNGEANVRQSTRDRVKDAAKSLNYRPNFSARSLASKRSFVVVHFQDNPNPDYLAKISKGMQNVCREMGYFAVMESLQHPYPENAVDYLQTFDVDGLILSPPLSDNLELLNVLEARKVPYVRISPRVGRERSSYTGISDKNGMRDMAEHILSQGHKDIAYVSGPSNHGASSLREAGFQEALKVNGLDADKLQILNGDFSVRSGFEAAEKLFARGSKISAVLAANDDMAVGVIMAALKAGLSIPGDISVSGFDGSRLGEIIWPQLTTVLQPVEKMASRATEILLSEIVSPTTETTVEKFPVTLCVRGTTRTLPS